MQFVSLPPPSGAPLDSRQLSAFVCLARTGSFTRAAKELFLTQSAISHALKALEEDLGCRLFERGSRHVSLTPAGGSFRLHAERILEEMAAARAALDTLSTWGQSRLRVGASTTACQHILPAVLREFRLGFPHCALSIEPGDHARQLELLDGQQIDLAIMLAPADRPDLKCIPLFEDELRFVVAPAHPWAVRGRVSLASLTQETLILYSQASLTFRLVSRYFRAEGRPLGHFIEPGSMEAIKELVKIGVGVGILAPWTARAEIEGGALISFPLGRRRLIRKWGVVHKKSHPLSVAEETFAGLCRTVTEEFGVETASPSADPTD